MKLIKYKPTSPGIRHKIALQKNLLCKNNRLVKSLLKGSKKTGGRSTNTGRITSWHIGGGTKTALRSYIQTKEKDYSLISLGVFYDPNKSAFNSLNFDIFKKEFSFTTAVSSVTPGSLLISNKNLNDLKLGFRTSIKNIPTGSIIHNISLNDDKISFVRSAGTFGQIIQKDLNKSRVRLPSGKVKDISTESFATLGVVSNTLNKSTVYGKAGVSRLLGRRSVVRGVAMNPVDHPHGGRTNGGRPSCTPWGKPTKGKPTVKKSKL